MNGKSTSQKGQWAENIALNFLVGEKLVLLDRNYNTACGEIDLVMHHKNTIVFVEVRYRSANNFVSAVESIDKKKCERIIKSSHHFLQNRKKPDWDSCRFDVITVTGNESNFDIGWIKNAFQA